MWQRWIFSVNWENPQKYVGFSSFFTLKIWLFFFPSWQCCLPTEFVLQYIFWRRILDEILFGCLPCVLNKWCFPRCFLCRCPFYCMSIQCFTGNLSICDFWFWRRCSYSIWQLSVWEVWFLLMIISTSLLRETFHAARMIIHKRLLLAFTDFFWIFFLLVVLAIFIDFFLQKRKICNDVVSTNDYAITWIWMRSVYSINCLCVA